MNIVALIGNLANEPELRYTPSGRAVCSFRVAVSRPGGEHADFFDVVAWERQAEICHEYLHTGRRVSIEGRLHHTVWEVDSGRRSRVEIVAQRVQMIGPSHRSNDRGVAAPMAESVVEDGDSVEQEVESGAAASLA